MKIPPNLRFPAPDPQLPAPAAGRPEEWLWVDGGFRVHVLDPGTGVERVVRVERPFALVGRTGGADVQLDDSAVSSRHVYLHLDRRGLYAVDLATRTGTRFGAVERPAGWLQPGDALEVAGRRVTLLDLSVRDDTTAPLAESGPVDLLADAGAATLVRVTLYPGQAPATPRTLGSELVFLGRGACCGVRVEGASASRTHCVLVRTNAAAFVVDLVGRGTWLNGRPLRGARSLADGDALMVGSTPFEVRVEPPADPGPPDRLGPTGTRWPPLMPAEAQGTILAWVMGILQAQQGESLRRQDEFQTNLIAVIQQIHHDHATLLAKHLERMEAINRELAILRDEIRQRLGPAPVAAAGALPPPKPRPLRIIPTAPPPADPVASASWLIARVQQLEEENRSTWKDLLSRLAGTARRTT